MTGALTKLPATVQTVEVAIAELREMERRSSWTSLDAVGRLTLSVTEAALPYTRWSILEIRSHLSPKVLYSCREAGNNPRQRTLVKKVCQNQERCRIEVSREFFGDSECPGSNDASMKLWLVYSCHGGTDRTTSHTPDCDYGGGGCIDPGEKHHLKIPGCGGRANLLCIGGTIFIYKVTHPPTISPL